MQCKYNHLFYSRTFKLEKVKSQYRQGSLAIPEEDDSSGNIDKSGLYCGSALYHQLSFQNQMVNHSMINGGTLQPSATARNSFNNTTIFVLFHEFIIMQKNGN